MSKAVVAVIAALVTIGLTLVYAALDEQKFFVYLPYAIRGSADAPVPGSLEDRVLALETQVAQLSKLLTPTPTPTAMPSPTPTPTPWYQTVKAESYQEFSVYQRSLGAYAVELSVAPSVADSATSSHYAVERYKVPITITVTYNGEPVQGATILYDYDRLGRSFSDNASYLESAIKELGGVLWGSPDGGVLVSGVRIWDKVTTNASGMVTGTVFLRHQDIGRITNINIRVTNGDDHLEALKTIRLE